MKGEIVLPSTPEGFRPLFEASGLASYADRMLSLIEPAVLFTALVKPEDDLPVGASKCGGAPDLPSRNSWPAVGERPLPFVAQIDLSCLPDFDHRGDLPDSGLLSFFYLPEAFGYSPMDREYFRVFWFEESDLLERVPAPPGVDEFPCSFIDPFISLTLPLSETLAVEAIGLAADERGSYDGLCERVLKGADLRLLGHPIELQGEMQTLCEWVRLGFDLATKKGTREASRLDVSVDAQDWRLLLQIDSVEGSKMEWGDFGSLYFWIRRQDLRERRFENSWLVMQCY